MTEEQLRKHREDQIDAILTTIIKHENDVLGWATNAKLVTELRAEDGCVTRSNYHPDGHFMILVDWENTDATMRLTPYVAPATPPEKAAAWVMALIDNHPLPPDLKNDTDR